MILDLTFIHQRPQYIAFYWCSCIAMGNIALAFTAKIVSAGASWRAFYWVWLGPCVVAIVMALFCVPETYFERPPMAFDGHIISQDDCGRVDVYEKWDDVPGGKPVPYLPEFTSKRDTLKRILFWNRTATAGLSAIKAFPRQILICSINPLILWAFILNALVSGGTALTSLVYADVLMASPYDYTFNEIALLKFSPVVGAILAYPASGLLTSWLTTVLARRNRGIHEPEHYLPSFILPVITSCVSLALFGAAAEKLWNPRWFYLFIGLNYFSSVAMFVSYALWVTDAFPQWAGAAITIIEVGAGISGFVDSTSAAAWMESQPMGKMFLFLSMLTACFGLLGIPIGCWGKRFREYIALKW